MAFEQPKETRLPITTEDELSAAVMTQIALYGGAFDWLKGEPELYSDQDGEPLSAMPIPSVSRTKKIQ
ncbi:hypothetical protein DCC62_23295 [candidate division KSB1 bacterium]|nr:MAG: hypothetical protein DCC62_23295 [candidate division KSB1 bacterium]